MKDIRNFIGGINTDDDPRNMPNGDYLDASSISVGMSKVGGVRNMLGNTLIPYTMPSGVNTCIGSLRNIRENSIIYFVYNDLGNHSILEYYCQTKTIEPIFIPFTTGTFTFDTSFLGFTLENKIHSSNILDDILTWVDNNVSPRKINKKSAREFVNQVSPSATAHPYDNLIATGTLAEKLQFIELIKYKPSTEPIVSTDYDPDRQTNYIKEKMVQAKFRYIYDDNEYSRWSDGSFVTLPDGDENALGLIPSTTNNFVNVLLDTGHPTVKAIDVAFRFSNTGIWAKLDTPIKLINDDNERIVPYYTLYNYQFYNDSVLIEIDDDLDNYDSVPQVSATQAVVEGNRLILANNVEGYQNPELDIDITPDTTEIDLGITIRFGINSDPVPNASDFYFSDNVNPNAQLWIPVNRPSWFTVGMVYTFNLRKYDAGPTFDKTYTVSYTVTEADLALWPSRFCNNLVIQINKVTSAQQPVGANLSSFFAGFWRVLIGDSTSSGEYTEATDLRLLPPIAKNISWKKGAFHAFGIVYRDIQGRDGGVVTDVSMNWYNQYLPEYKATDVNDNQTAILRSPKFTISHTPPEWAHTYEIVYAGNDLQKYTQFAIKASAINGVNVNGNVTIDCSYIIDYITKTRVVTSVDFQFEVGDYLRFVANEDYYVADYIEVKVLEFDTTTNVLTVTAFDSSKITNNMTVPSQQGVIVELFRRKSNTAGANRPYFSIGQSFEIINPGTAQRAHQGNFQSQTSIQPAITILSRGDTYVYRRYFDTVNTFAIIVESENFSDFYPSKNIDISSIYAVIPNGKTKRYEQGIRYSGRYLSNTNINDMNRFNGSDFDTLNTNYGPITKLVTLGYTLKVLQVKKNTSIYIDRNMIFNANGDSQLTLVDKVLGNKNPSEEDYGCAHPESVIVDDRHIFFFDVNTGTVIQDSANGMYPISDYKAKVYFRDIANLIKDKTGIYVYTGIDHINSYINFTFVDTNVVPVIDNQTIVYNTKDNRWKSKMPYIPEYYGSNAMVMVGFKNGQLWEYNTNEVRNNFFGQQFESSLTFPSNIAYPKVKVFNAIAVYANKTWYSPEIGDISIFSSENYQQGMASRLIKSKFRWKEGVAYSDYLRDALSPNFASQQLALMNGRKLRGQFLIQKLVSDETEEAELYSVIVHTVDSELSA